LLIWSGSLLCNLLQLLVFPTLLGCAFRGICIFALPRFSPAIKTAQQPELEASQSQGKALEIKGA
jgi:hypothetical protein